MTNPLGLIRQTSTLVVVEPKPLATKLLFEDPILFAEVFKGELLLLVHPASQPRRSARTGMGRESSASSMPIIASAGHGQIRRIFRQIQFPDHTGSGSRESSPASLGRKPKLNSPLTRSLRLGGAQCARFDLRSPADRRKMLHQNSPVHRGPTIARPVRRAKDQFQRGQRWASGGNAGKARWGSA